MGRKRERNLTGRKRDRVMNELIERIFVNER